MAMTPQTERTSGYHKAVRPRTVVVVSCHPDRHVIEAVLGAVEHDVVLVEPTAGAYSHIKHIRPDLVILCMAGDDTQGCLLLSMLTLDRETSRIPGVAHVIETEDEFPDWSNLTDDDVRPVVTTVLN
jgi:PleD family two-component response regulator